MPALPPQPLLPLLPSFLPPFPQPSLLLQVVRRVEAIEARPAGAPADVVVVGAGYAGVELASTVAERLGTQAAVELVSAGST